MSSLISHFYKFGEFAVDVDQRVLLHHEKRVAITPKVFDTLLLLVENSGRLVTKEELMRSLWPDSFVEESNLTFNIQQIRKSLGDNARKPVFVETVSRRGYRFIAEVEEVLTDVDMKRRQISIGSNGARAKRKRQVDEFIVKQASSEAFPIKKVAQNDSVVSEIASRRAVLIAGLLAVLLSATGLMIWRFSHSANRNQNEKHSTEFSSSTLSTLKVEKLTANGKSSGPVISPDGKFVAYVSETKGQ